MVEPGGNSTTRWQSHRTKCPPFLGSNEPRAVTAHHPKGKLAKSVCLKHAVCGPKLYVVAAKMLEGKLRLREGSCVCRAWRVFS